MLAVIAVASLRLRNLFTVTMFFGAYSLASALLFVLLDAVDVAFTEAAVGAGVSTLLILGTLTQTTIVQKPSTHSRLLSLAVVTITGAALIYGTLDLPHFGDPNAPAQQHVAPHYIEVSPKEIGIPNMVTSVLASYRGFDTLGEVIVVFIAGIGVVILLLAGSSRSEPFGNDNKER